MQPSTNNARYILELERKALLQEKYGFDEKYGTFSFAFLTSLEVFALLAYLYIATVLIYSKKTRTKTNFIVSVWAVINFGVLVEKLLRECAVVLIGDDFGVDEEVTTVTQMVAALGRCYGTILMVGWLCEKFAGTTKPKYDPFFYFLISLPAIITLSYVYYYFEINKFIFEVYGPACDIINLAVYSVVGFIYILCKIFSETCRDISRFGLIVSLVNLITNFPICLIRIYLRFVLDISWIYRLHIYFVDFFVDILNVSAPFVVLFTLFRCNDEVKREKIKKVSPESDHSL